MRKQTREEINRIHKELERQGKRILICECDHDPVAEQATTVWLDGFYCTTGYRMTCRKCNAVLRTITQAEYIEAKRKELDALEKDAA